MLFCELFILPASHLQAVRSGRPDFAFAVQNCAAGGWFGMADTLTAPRCLLCTSTTGCHSHSREMLQPLAYSSAQPGTLEQDEVSASLD